MVAEHTKLFILKVSYEMGSKIIAIDAYQTKSDGATNVRIHPKNIGAKWFTPFRVKCMANSIKRNK